MPSSRDEISQAQYELLLTLRHSLRLFERFSEEAARAAGISPTQHQALLAIKGFRGPRPISIGELAELLCIRHHSAVGLVDRLIESQYVVRTTDAADRRRVHLALSKGGEKILKSLSVVHRDELSRIGPHVKTVLDRLRGDSRTRA